MEMRTNSIVKEKILCILMSKGEEEKKRRTKKESRKTWKESAGMDIIAVTDIDEGDEITVSYGMLHIFPDF